MKTLSKTAAVILFCLAFMLTVSLNTGCTTHPSSYSDNDIKQVRIPITYGVVAESKTSDPDGRTVEDSYIVYFFPDYNKLYRFNTYKDAYYFLARAYLKSTSAEIKGINK